MFLLNYFHNLYALLKRRVFSYGIFSYTTH
nr:MAG TPA: hypothetical protein [Caudoviricetes sp.]